MVTAIWSDDPEFYETLTGGRDINHHIFVKKNCSDVSAMVDRFKLSRFSDNSFYRSDEHKYICVVEQTIDKAIEQAQQMIQTI